MSEAVDKAISSALEAFLNKHLATFQQELKQELAQALDTGGGSASAALNSAYYRIAGARSQTEILQSLLDASASFAARSALLVIKGDRLMGWRARGFEGSQGEKVRELNIAADGDEGWRRALTAQAATTGVVEPAPKALAQTFFDAAGPPAEERGYLLPIVVRERPVAALYADAGRAATADLPALELLTRITGLQLELMVTRQRPAAAAAASAPSSSEIETEAALAPAAVSAPAAAAYAPPSAEPPAPAPVAAAAAAPPAPVAAPAPAAPRAPGPDFDSIPAADHDIHKKAYRSAKLLVDDLINYNKEKLEKARAAGDIYNALREDFDKSRTYYEKKWMGTPAGKVDYFHQEVVRRLANNNPSLLGTDYPGPLV